MAKSKKAAPAKTGEETPKTKKATESTMSKEEAQAIVNKHESIGPGYEPAELVQAREVLKEK